jgi:hypothetical protein
VDRLAAMRGTRNQVDITELLCQNAETVDSDTWLNKALQQDRFQFIPAESINLGEIEVLQQTQGTLFSRCVNEQIIPLSYQHQILYLGLLRYDPEFPELAVILKSVPSEITTCLVPLAPKEFVPLLGQVRSVSH